MSGEMVTITLEEYLELQDAVQLLHALRSAGVDNWDGYDMAIDIYNGDE